MDYLQSAYNTLADGSLKIYHNYKTPSIVTMMHYVWLLTHTLTLLATILYCGGISEIGISITRPTLYRVISLSTVSTYTIVLCRRYFTIITSPLKGKLALTRAYASLDNPVTLSEILKTEKAQLLMLALLWLSTSPNITKMIPFAIYSFLNLGVYVLNDVFPEFQFSMAIRPLMEYLETPLLITAAHLDTMIFFILAKECYITGNGYSLLIYLVIWGLRVESSEASRCSLYTLLTMIDYLVFQDYNPIWCKNSWTTVKQTITTLVPLTTFDKEEAASIYNFIDQFLPSPNVESYSKESGN